MDMPKLLSEAEIAEQLRCSTGKVKRLRLSGKLAYLPGRPVLVREADFLAFLEAETARTREKEERRAAQAAPKQPDLSIEGAMAWARMARLKRQWRAETAAAKRAQKEGG